MKYFDSTGKMKPETSFININLVDEDGYLLDDLRIEVSENYQKFPGDSDIVAVYWLNQAAMSTHGNYTPDTFLVRCMGGF